MVRFPLSILIKSSGLRKREFFMDDAVGVPEEIGALLGMRGAGLAAVRERADRLRARIFGDAVNLRGIIEFSNRCARDCFYCGIRASNGAVKRYTMEADEIVAAARAAADGGCRTVVLQSGEPPALGDEALGAVIGRIKDETGVAVTLSCGVRPREVYRRWRAAGMDRYLLRFETSDPELYAALHPDSTLDERLGALADLREAGVQVGSGFLIGVPGETIDVLGRNILLCRELELDMIGVGPFIAHPGTPLGGSRNAWADDAEMFFAAVAVLRLFNPEAHIPATTAFDALFPGDGRERLLAGGANVFMPNVTPQPYRAAYELYPGKPCREEAGVACIGCARLRIEALGRTIAEGPGHGLRTERS